METNGRENDITANNHPISRIAFNQIYLRAQDGILEVHRIIDMPPDVKNLKRSVSVERLKVCIGQLTQVRPYISDTGARTRG